MSTIVVLVELTVSTKSTSTIQAFICLIYAILALINSMHNTQTLHVLSDDNRVLSESHIYYIQTFCFSDYLFDVF